MVIHGHTWSYMVIHCHTWSYIVIHGHSIVQLLYCFIVHLTPNPSPIGEGSELLTGYLLFLFFYNVFLCISMYFCFLLFIVYCSLVFLNLVSSTSISFLNLKYEHSLVCLYIVVDVSYQ